MNTYGHCLELEHIFRTRTHLSNSNTSFEHEHIFRTRNSDSSRTLTPLSNSNCLFQTQTVSFEFELSLLNSNCLFRIRTVSFEFELSLSNSNCPKQASNPINSSRPSSGIIGSLERADPWVLFQTRTVFELELSLSNSAHSADRQLCCRLELSKTSFQWPFRRKAPIGNEVANPRRTLPGRRAGDRPLGPF